MKWKVLHSPIRMKNIESLCIKSSNVYRRTCFSFLENSSISSIIMIEGLPSTFLCYIERKKKKRKVYSLIEFAMI